MRPSGGRSARPRHVAPSPEGAKWVPVTERPLPKDDGTYLVTDGKHVAPMVRALIENNVGTPWDWDFGAKIPHWMPLPGAPK
jgi:hypothetical protein